MEPERIAAVLEAVLFMADAPVAFETLAGLFDPSEAGPDEVRAALDAIRWRYANGGFVLAQVAGGFAFSTNPACADWIARYNRRRPERLSTAALEVMAVVAYKQPVTRTDIEDVRGVDSGGVIRTLIDRQLIRIAGRRNEPGRPHLYGVTRRFLELFNLRSIEDLPPLEEFYRLTPEEREALTAMLEGVPPAEGAASVDTGATGREDPGPSDAPAE